MISAVLQPGPRRWLDESVLAPFEEQYLLHLHSGRYSPATIRDYFACLAHFARWATHERISLRSIDEVARCRFLTEHLPRCSCPDPVRRTPHELRAGIRHLLTVLRAQGAISRSEDHDRLTTELAAFDSHMRDVGGLAETTRRQRQGIVGRFLAEQFKRGEIVASRIDGDAVRRFVLGHDHGWGAGAIRVAGGAIGCYLKFRQMLGDDVLRLIAAIPRAPHWRLAGLPEVLSDTQIDKLLAAFPEGLPSRRRAYAMVRCVTDLGLRCAEVVKLRLDDIDWHHGIVRIARTKTHFTDRLPLPAVTGEAIADYVQNERPKTKNQAIFVRHVAPYDVPIRSGVAKHAVIAAFARCGWERTDPHIIRHSVASRLLRKGVPMKHIADILRHRSLDTSKIYTKIDLDRLAAVALPWPGRAV
jgi:integrase/recombinase XerD